MDMKNKQFMCGEVEAELYKNVDGSYSIDKIITAKWTFHEILLFKS